MAGQPCRCLPAMFAALSRGSEHSISSIIVPRLTMMYQAMLTVYGGPAVPLPSSHVRRVVQGERAVQTPPPGVAMAITLQRTDKLSQYDHESGCDLDDVISSNCGHEVAMIANSRARTVFSTAQEGRISSCDKYLQYYSYIISV